MTTARNHAHLMMCRTNRNVRTRVHLTRERKLHCIFSAPRHARVKVVQRTQARLQHPARAQTATHTLSRLSTNVLKRLVLARFQRRARTVAYSFLALTSRHIKASKRARAQAFTSAHPQPLADTHRKLHSRNICAHARALSLFEPPAI